MLTEIRLQAPVLPGSRVEIKVPELREGQVVEVLIRIPDEGNPHKQRRVLDFLDALPPVAQNWDEREREFQEERNSWEH